MKAIVLPAVLLAVIHCPASAQMRTDPFLENLLNANQDSLMRAVLQQKGKYRVQVIYTRIDRDASNRPSFKNFYFNCGDSLYYYPASTVKLPLAALSLEKLDRLAIPGVNKYTRALEPVTASTLSKAEVYS